MHNATTGDTRGRRSGDQSKLVATHPLFDPGEAFGVCVVLGRPFWVRPHSESNLRQAAVAECECGVVRIVDLSVSPPRSCRCDHAMRSGDAGHTTQPLYRVWQGMKARCMYPRHQFWRYYGGRGISVCDEWVRSFKSFQDWATVNGYLQGLELDRISVNGNYEPGNCRFVLPCDNKRNTRRRKEYVGFGEPKTAREWGLDGRCVAPQWTVENRIRSGWNVEDAVLTPSKGGAVRVTSDEVMCG